MKKLYVGLRFKEWNRKNAAKSLDRRLKIAERTNKKRRTSEGFSRAALVERDRRKDRTKGFTQIEAPKNLSFISNTEEMVSFIARLNDHWQQKQPVWIDLRNVDVIRYDGVVVLLSVMVRFKALGIKFNGDFPRSQNAREVLMSSGFFSGLGLPWADTESYKVKGDHGIATHARKFVDASLSDRLIQKAGKTIWGKPHRCQGAQRVFLELMQNTNNHASPEGRGEKHWWVSVFHDVEAKKVSFAFVDYGVGVFKSLRTKQAGDKFFGALEKIFVGVADRLRFSDAIALRKILDGDLHRTASGKYYRGKGLPGIKEALDRGWISNLHIVTNTVKAAVSADRFEVLPQNFEGTFLFWEMNDGVKHCENDDDQSNKSI